MAWFPWPGEEDTDEGPPVPASVIDGIEDIEEGRIADGEAFDEVFDQ